MSCGFLSSSKCFRGNDPRKDLSRQFASIHLWFGWADCYRIYVGPLLRQLASRDIPAIKIRILEHSTPRRYPSRQIQSLSLIIFASPNVNFLIHLCCSSYDGHLWVPTPTALRWEVDRLFQDFFCEGLLATPLRDSNILLCWWCTREYWAVSSPKYGVAVWIPDWC